MRLSPEKKLEREKVRMTLMRATLELAETHGFSSLGLREVSRAAGIAPTSFYRHFADVEELGLGIVERLVAPVFAPLLERAGEGDAPRVIVCGLLELAQQDPELCRFMLAERSGAIASFRLALAEQFELLTEPLSAGLPSAAPSGVGSAVVEGILAACGELLSAHPKDRDAERVDIERRTLNTVGWLLRRTGSEGGAHG